MPILPVDSMVADCDAWEESVVRAAFTTRGVSEGGRLRTNKPFRKVSTKLEGCANYVWRMLCFDLVGWGKHACMPVCADFDLMEALEVSPAWRDRSREEHREGRRELMKEMDELTKRVESVLPIEAQKGIIRWGRALGMI
jgi:hypothetical protein